MGRRILITGGAGFIGYHLARAVSSEAEDEVVLVDNLARGRFDADLEALCRRPNVRFLEGDVSNSGMWAGLGGVFDEVYHLAAVIGVRHVLERPHDVLRVNAVGTLLLLDWFSAAAKGKLLFASTSEVYGWTQLFHPLPVPTPEDVPLALTDLRNPRSSYAGSKIFGELAVSQMCARKNLRFTIVRFHNVYGPRMGYDHVIPELAERAGAGENPLTVYAADHRRAFCYVDDAVRACLLAVRRAEGDGETFNVGNDREELAMRDLATQILRHLGRNGGISDRSAVNDPIVRRCPDISKARTRLGYEPRVPLDAGLDRTLSWYKEHPRPPQKGSQRE